jgi:hypothetical protein
MFLNGTSLTDAVFASTDNIRTLKFLSVIDTKVTPAATEIFRANHPSVELHPTKQ